MELEKPTLATASPAAESGRLRSLLSGLRGMAQARVVLLAGASVIGLLGLAPALGQAGNNYWQCKTTNEPGWCPVSLTAPMPIQIASGSISVGSLSIGNISSGIIATSAVPTLVAGSATPYGDLSGAALSHPVFGPLTGGGDQPVDNSHGLPVALATAPALATSTAVIGKVSPVDSGGTDASDTANHAWRVNVVAGSTGNAAAGSTGSAVPGSADYTGGNIAGILRGITASNYTGTSYALDVNVATSPLATNPIPGQASHGVNIGGVEGLAAALSAAVGNPVQEGCVVHTAAPTSGTDGQIQPHLCGEKGQQVYQPYAIKEVMVRGATSVNGTATTVIISAQGAGLKIYVTSMQCFRTDTATTMDYWTLTDTASTPLGIPGTGEFVTTFPVPLVATAANVPFSGKPAIGAATEYCNAQGYAGP